LSDLHCGASSLLTLKMPTCLPTLVAALFLAEFSRNAGAFISGKMLLDLIDVEAKLKCNSIPVTWSNALCHPNYMNVPLSGKHATGQWDKIGGLHPMTHTGSYDPDFLNGPTSMDRDHLSWAHVKMAVLACEWLSRYLTAHGVDCTILSKTELESLTLATTSAQGMAQNDPSSKPKAAQFLSEVMSLLHDRHEKVLLLRSAHDIPSATLSHVRVIEASRMIDVPIPTQEEIEQKKKAQKRNRTRAETAET